MCIIIAIVIVIKSKNNIFKVMLVVKDQALFKGILVPKLYNNNNKC